MRTLPLSNCTEGDETGHKGVERVAEGITIGTNGLIQEAKELTVKLTAADVNSV